MASLPSLPKPSDATFLTLTEIGCEPITIIPALFSTVFKAFVGKVLGKALKRYTRGLPATLIPVVIVVPSLFDIVTLTGLVLFVATTTSFALLQYCQGAGAM
ncbi:hypothetical protein D3C71_1768060 [compost metagenome]